MEFKKLKIEDLIPASYNPRKKLKPGDSEFEKIKNSIEEFGYVDPVIVNKDMTVIGGHQRITVLKTLGYTEIDCVVIDIDKTKEKALNIALNKISGEWNKELLADLIKDLQSLDYDVSFTGFDPPEIDELFNEIHDKEIKEDDFDVAKELEEPAITQKGDVWLLGRHRLVCGDSTDPEVYRVLMNGQKANLVVTDPPYNVNYSAQAGTIQNDNLQDDEFYNFLLKAFANMAACMEKDASIYVFHADTEGYNFRKAFRDAGFYLSGVCIWAKQSLVLGRSPYQWKHEPILFGWLKGGKHNWYADRKQSTIWNFDRPSKNALHPTMKPVSLCAYPIQNSSMSNCIVLDPFGGSGSTLIACEQTNRICYTIELDEKYADVIVKRYIEQVGSDSEVFLERNGDTIPYLDVLKPSVEEYENSNIL
ncbi:site-specific DNA-methyltransferase [Schinkia azotoformans]|uniref:site-specific DNA-methyltransferase n=1 Tax=Schinkia azotoformans TaxID=1454 RepID=UPI002DB75569|nr:site-specific DNA-methyltransferase [Schinkia azotoformans]MEC1719088.1 site-specific DNA-methyltransferase [Schinkia azotoformans]MED4413864.1 site-specific DNA-methyltransferase [Schinkia azotoformans]